ncbi:MAG: DUF2284 domain-containing protein [Chloroflexi bacterium]|nr:DUF2284 domain-containing protein [Chloroflexota bacterium]
MVRKIMESIPEEMLQEDLEKLRQRAIELGATDAKIITTDMVVIDERVRMKCIYPKCQWFGTNRHCPPYAMDLDQARKLSSSYRYALFIRQVEPTDTLAGERSPEQMKEYQRKTKMQLDILRSIEADAFYSGYYLAIGFGAGPCKRFFCPTEECTALKPGQGCRYPLYARSSMEAQGMDVYKMATRVGWDIYPLGSSHSEAPHGNRLSLMFIY